MLLKYLGEVVCDCGFEESGKYYPLLSNRLGWACENPFGPCIYTNEEVVAAEFGEAEEIDEETLLGCALEVHLEYGIDLEDACHMHGIKLDQLTAKNFLIRFFEEKQLSSDVYIIEHNGLTHVVDTDAMKDIIINQTAEEEQNTIWSVLQAIDFNNGDVHHYLRYLADCYIKNQFRSEEARS